MSKIHNIGIYGTGAMGIALARNFARNNYKVAVSNRTTKKGYLALKSIKKYKESKNISYKETLEELVEEVKGPIILLVKSGDPQEDLINATSTTPIDDVIFNGSESISINGKLTMMKPLIELVNKEHIIIDAGNSHPYTTSIRDLKLSKKNIKFLGMGVSGGEMGALKGPSLMPGGAYSTYKEIEKILQKVAAKKNNVICCNWMGPAGAGHFVKTIHNGIEYAIMQAIAEAYWMLRNALNLRNDEIEKFFKDCNKGIFRSYLLEISSHIFSKRNSKSDKFIIDEIQDIAGAKGTGKWTTQIAGDLGIGAGAIYSALESRQISNKKIERNELSKINKTKKSIIHLNNEKIIQQTKDALFSNIIISYIQGFQILLSGSNQKIYTAPHMQNTKNLYNYKKEDLLKELNLSNIANVWKSGCIIRSNLLYTIDKIFKEEKTKNLILSKILNNLIQKYYKGWKNAILFAIKNNIPYQLTSSCFNYYNTFRSDNLPLNLTQAQRDLFGAHTFKKKNGLDTIYHYYWGKKYSLTKSYKQ